MRLVTLSSYGTDLSSRATGKTVRNLIVRHPETGRTVVDCTGLRTMSESFADELFGVLVAQKGKPWFKEHIQVAGLTESIRITILRVIDARVS